MIRHLPVSGSRFQPFAIPGKGISTDRRTARLQRVTGVMFFIDPRNNRVTLAEVYQAETPLTGSPTRQVFFSLDDLAIQLTYKVYPSRSFYQLLLKART